jgi:dTDP-4-dehydrorhamnose reductase
MLRLQREGRPIRVVDDQELTPTYTRHVARKVAQLVETTAYGLYHVTNAGSCTWYQFARRIFALAGLPVDLQPQTTAEAGRPAPRPAYSVLAHAGLAKLGLADMPPWDEALREFLIERGLYCG